MMYVVYLPPPTLMCPWVIPPSFLSLYSFSHLDVPLGDGDHDRGHPCGAWPVNVGTVPQERPALVEVTGAEGREVFDTHTHTHTSGLN